MKSRNRRIFYYPCTDIDNIFIHDESPIFNPICVCSMQESFDNYGIYQWDDESKNILFNYFKNIYYIDIINEKLIIQNNIPFQGLFFIGDDFSKISSEIYKYKIKKLKNSKKNIPIVIENPIEEILHTKEIKISTINNMFKEKYKFIYFHFYIEKSGKTLIIFDDNMLNNIIEDLHATRINSYDNLKYW